jgi:hypothetical protein
LPMNEHAWRPRMLGIKYYNSQIAGHVKKAVPLHINIPHPGERRSELHFMLFCKNIRNFVTNSLYFFRSSVRELLLYVLPFKQPQTEKSQRLKPVIRFGPVPLLIILTPRHRHTQYIHAWATM